MCCQSQCIQKLKFRCGREKQLSTPHVPQHRPPTDLVACAPRSRVSGLPGEHPPQKITVLLGSPPKVARNLSVNILPLQSFLEQGEANRKTSFQSLCQGLFNPHCQLLPPPPGLTPAPRRSSALIPNTSPETWRPIRHHGKSYPQPEEGSRQYLQ